MDAQPFARSPCFWSFQLVHDNHPAKRMIETAASPGESCKSCLRVAAGWGRAHMPAPEHHNSSTQPHLWLVTERILEVPPTLGKRARNRRHWDRPREGRGRWVLDTSLARISGRSLPLVEIVSYPARKRPAAPFHGITFRHCKRELWSTGAGTDRHTWPSTGTCAEHVPPVPSPARPNSPPNPTNPQDKIPGGHHTL